MFKKTVLLIVFITLSFFPVKASESLLKTLKQNINELEQKYNSLKKQAKTVSDNIELTERKIEILKTKRKMLIAEREQTKEEIKNLEEEIARLKKEIAETKKYLKKRLAELYKRGDYAMLEALLSPSEESEYIYQLSTLSYLSAKDRESLKKLKKLTEEKKTKAETLRNKEIQLVETIKKLNSTERELRIALIDQKKLYRKLKRQKSKYLALLKERNKILKVLIESLSKKPTPQNPSAVPMDKFKGLLSLPVRGRIIEKFGTYTIGKYKAKVKNNGITIKVRKGKKVRAFYDGVVVFADWYKSYGKLVIIDHGFGYYTFYAHLDKIFVKINQIVSKGEPIGLTGNTASLQGNILHFEIWKNKKPLNPLKWVKKR